jgi:hypothetical protein
MHFSFLCGDRRRIYLTPYTYVAERGYRPVFEQVIYSHLFCDILLETKTPINWAYTGKLSKFCDR